MDLAIFLRMHCPLPDIGFIVYCATPVALGLDGLVSKHRDSVYRGGRSPRWIKVKNRKHPAFSRVMDSFG